jgi:hypothetical protein
MRERRKWKNKHTEEVQAKNRQLSNELSRETENARAELWQRECKEMGGVRQEWQIRYGVCKGLAVS